MANVITDVDQVTPAWLTGVLRAQGVLQGGEVAEVTQTHSKHTNVSTVYYLLIRYTQEEPLAPKKLFLKLPSAHFTWPGWGKKEFRFYTEIIPAMLQRYDWADLPLVRPYDVAYAQETEQSHYLFEDLRETFFTADRPVAPTPAYREQVMDALALFHAFWWEHPRLTQDLGELLTRETLAGWISQASAKHDDFVGFMGSRLSKAQADILHAVTHAWPRRRAERLIQGKGITLVHRDLHPLNLLYSQDAERASVKVIDWESWRVDTGTDDLAYMIACHWPVELRETVERALLERYHAQLVHLGVKDYSWPDCWYDYRASVIRCLFFLLVAWSPKQWERGYWWEKVELGMHAFTQLGCMELLAARA